MISLIVAIDENRGMGYENNLLCHIPKDLLWFKKRTKGKPVIMGRNTALSLKKPLPHRHNIVLSRSGWSEEGFLVCETPLEALRLSEEYLTRLDTGGQVNENKDPQNKEQASKGCLEEDTLDGWRFFNPLNEIVVIGGAQIYKEFLDMADCLDITHIHSTYPADVFFPTTSDFLMYDSHFFEGELSKSPNFTIARYRKKG